MADEDISSSDEYSGPKVNHSELLDKWKSDALPKRKKRNKVIHAMNKLGMSTSYDTFLRNKKLIKKLQDGGVIEASSTTESIVNDMFGEERVDFQNIPTSSTQREITGDTTEDIISEVLKQLDLGWQLPVKNAEELNDVLAQKLEGRMRAQFEHLCEFWDLLLKNFTFDDLNVETYKKLSSFACSKKNNPLFDDSDELGGVNSAIFDVARIERFLFKYPAGSSKVSNSAWRNLYHSLVDACVRSVRRSYSINQPADGEDKLSSDLDRTMLSPFICHKGECKFDVKMIIEGDAKPSPETEMSPPGSPGTSETSTGIEKERSITVRAVPDLTIYSMWEFWKLIQTIPILVIEVPYVHASKTRMEHIDAFFGADTVEFINIPTSERNNKKLTGDTEDEVIESVLSAMRGANLVASDTAQFKNLIDKEICEQSRKNIDYLTDVIKELSQIISFDDASEDYYRNLYTISEEFIFKFPQAESILSALKKIARHEKDRFCGIGTREVLHRNWTLLYENLLSNVLTNTETSSHEGEGDADEAVERSYFVYGHGDSVFCFTMEVDSNQPIKIIETCPSDSGSSTSSLSACKSSLLQMRATPDLTACVIEETKVSDVKFPLLIVEVKTRFIIPKREQDVQKLDSDSNKNDEDKDSTSKTADVPPKRKHNTDVPNEMKLSAKKPKLDRNAEPGSSSATNSTSSSGSTLEKSKTQHFFELVAPMKDSSSSKCNFSRPCKTFGLYIVKNKVFSTCLTIVTPITTGRYGVQKVKEFVSFTKFSEYVETVKDIGTKFRYIFSDYLDLFNPVHFRVFLWYITYLFECEEKQIEYVL